MKSVRLIGLIAFVFLAAAPLQATIRNVPGQYARIQHAVDFANDGDTVLLAPNTYTGVGNRSVLILNKGLTIMGDGDPSLVIIHPNDTNWYRAFAVIDPPSAVRFENLTIEKAWGYDSDSLYAIYKGLGSGVLAVNAAIVINNCRFVECYALGSGGGIYSVNSTLSLNNCQFESCFGEEVGAALFLDSSTTCSVSNSSFARGWVGYSGGAILADGADLIIQNCDFSDNLAYHGYFENEIAGFGGAIRIRRQGTLKVVGSRFLRNWTWAYGGAIMGTDSYIEIDSSLFAGNYVRRVWDGQSTLAGHGGAIYALNGSCVINSASFIDNRATGSFPVVYISAPTATIHQTIIAESDTGSAFGGYADFTCSNIFGNALGDWTGSIASQLGQNGNISEDPLFCGSFPGDYRLGASSPCAAENNSCGLTMGSETVGCDIICGDADLSGVVTISDAVFLIQYIFANGEPPAAMQSADVDCSGTVNISDVVYLLNYVFSGGLNPCNACP